MYTKGGPGVQTGKGMITPTSQALVNDTQGSRHEHPALFTDRRSTRAGQVEVIECLNWFQASPSTIAFFFLWCIPATCSDIIVVCHINIKHNLLLYRVEFTRLDLLVVLRLSSTCSDDIKGWYKNSKGWHPFDRITTNSSIQGKQIFHPPWH